MWKLLLASFFASSVLVLPGAATAQVASRDSVVFSGGPGRAGVFEVVALDATSGPSGEDPTGGASFIVAGSLLVGGPVTCLRVRDSDATMNIPYAINGLGIVTIEVFDSGPDNPGADRFDALPTARAPGDCSPLPPTTFGGPLSGGDITVTDALPPPASRDQCKNGGWKSFGAMFENQGQCVALVERGPT